MSDSTVITRDCKLPSAWQYSIIRKVFMALSGLVLVAFLYGHWAGNTALLDGELAFNEYLAWLKSHPILHYGVWILIAAALLAHLSVGSSHWLRNRRARPVRYRRKKYQATTWAARTMMISGLTLLAFIGVHVAQVRGWLVFGDSDTVFQNIQAGFGRWPVTTLYVLGQIALAVHLYHGLWSQFQTLGVHHPRYNHLRRPFAVVLGVGIALLNITLVLLNLDVVQGVLI